MCSSDLFLFNEPGVQPPKIEAFPLSDADKQYEYLTNTSRTEVMLAHRVTTPLIFGIRNEGGGFGSNKDEMVIGLEIFTKQVIEPKQRKLSNAFEEILSYEMPEIEISVIPNTPLMTDNGATASVAPTTPASSDASAPLQASLEKKKHDHDVEMTLEDEQYWLNRLGSCGETIDLEEWELVHEAEAIRDSGVEQAFCENLKEFHLASLDSYADETAKSA